VVTELRAGFLPLSGANFFVVDEVLPALQQLAAWYRGQMKAEVVGITGSNGKTIVKEWLYQLLSDEPGIYRSPRSYNSQVGVPLSLLIKEKNPANLEKIYNLYNQLHNRQDRIRGVLPLMLLKENRNAIFPFNDYSNELIASKADLSIYLYNNAKKLLAFLSTYHLVT
jgi:hypothetical protein